MDAPAGQHPQIGPAIAVADEQQSAGLVEQHHLHSLRLAADEAPEPAAERVEEGEEAGHRASLEPQRGLVSGV